MEPQHCSEFLSAVSTPILPHLAPLTGSQGHFHVAEVTRSLPCPPSRGLWAPRGTLGHAPLPASPPPRWLPWPPPCSRLCSPAFRSADDSGPDFPTELDLTLPPPTLMTSPRSGHRLALLRLTSLARTSEAPLRRAPLPRTPRASPDSSCPAGSSLRPEWSPTPPASPPRDPLLSAFIAAPVITSHLVP